MAGRVLSTTEAINAVQQMQRIINGSLLNEINSLRQQVNILTDPNRWDGALATQMRPQLQDTVTTLSKVQQQLEELRMNAQKINSNIMTAGGN